MPAYYTEFSPSTVTAKKENKKFCYNSKNYL